MEKERLHIFKIFKLLFMLIFVAELHALKLLIEAYRIHPTYIYFYDLRTFAESLIYSVLILLSGAFFISKII